MINFVTVIDSTAPCFSTYADLVALAAMIAAYGTNLVRFLAASHLRIIVSLQLQTARPAFVNPTVNRACGAPARLWFREVC